MTFIGPKMFDLEMKFSLTGKLDNALLSPFDMYFLESTLLNLMANELKKYPYGIFISNISNTAYDFQIAQDGQNDTINLRATINGVILSNWPSFNLNFFALSSFSSSLPSLIDSLTTYSRFQELGSVTCNILSSKSDREVADSTNTTLIIMSILLCLSFFGISILIAFRKSTEDRKDNKLSKGNGISIESDIKSSEADVDVGSLTKSASEISKTTRSSSSDDSTLSKSIVLPTRESENEDETNALKECAPINLSVSETRKKYDEKRKLTRRHSISNKPSTIAQRERKTAGEAKVARRHSISNKPSSSEQLEKKTIGRRQLIIGEQTLVNQKKNIRTRSISDKPSAYVQRERETIIKRKVERRHSISCKPSSSSQKEGETTEKRKVARSTHSISDKTSLFEQQERKTTGKRNVTRRRHSISDKPSTIEQEHLYSKQTSDQELPLVEPIVEDTGINPEHQKRGT